MTKTESKEGRSSVLAKLTSEVMAEKKAEARKLTPVTGEKGAQLPSPELPNDVGVFMSNERLLDHAKALRAFAAEAIVIADGLDAMLRQSSNPDDEPVDLDAARKAKEREADARIAAKQAAANDNAPEEEPAEETEFAKDFAAKAKAAQDAVFTPTEDVADDVWKCPTHGKPGVQKTSNKTGREYVGCPDCNLFAR